jgi:hypothetical protein
MLKLSFNNSDARVAASIRAKGPQIVQAVLRRMNVLMLELQAKIVGQKLQGQVLAHRTGKRAARIRVVPAVVEGTSVIGEVQGAGGPAFYGRVHEFGGTFSIPAHERKLGGIKDKMKARMAGGMVRAHSAVFPQRSFMRTSLEEMRGRIFEGLTQVVTEELAK